MKKMNEENEELESLDNDEDAIIMNVIMTEKSYKALIKRMKDQEKEIKRLRAENKRLEELEDGRLKSPMSFGY